MGVDHRITDVPANRTADPVEMAVLAANIWKRKRVSAVSDWAEFISPAWIRIAHDLDRGVTDYKLLMLAAKRGIQEYLRDDVHRGGYGYSRSGCGGFMQNVSCILGERYGGIYGVLEPADTSCDDPHRRMLELWGETRFRRRTLSIRERVVLYLYYVEEMALATIGTYFDMCQSRVSQLLSVAENVVTCNGYVDTNQRRNPHIKQKLYYLRHDGGHKISWTERFYNANKNKRRVPTVVRD